MSSNFLAIKTDMLVYLVTSLIENRQEVNRMASRGIRVRSQVQSQGAEPGCRARVQSQGAEPGCRVKTRASN